MDRKFKDLNNKVHQIDDQFTYLLPAGCIEITDAEALLLVNPTPTLADSITSHLNSLASFRYAKETGGLSVGGAVIETSRDSQALITGAYTALKNGVATQVNYKANGNIWITLTAAQFYPVAEAVFAHVQACFDNERTHSQAIQALTSVASVAAYDFTTGWPT